MFFSLKANNHSFNASHHKEAVSQYINIHYVEDNKTNNGDGIRYSIPNDDDIKYSKRYSDRYDSDEIAKLLSTRSSKQIDNIIARLADNTDKTFVEEVQQIIKQNGLRDSKVYKAAGVDRRLFSHMMSDTHYQPSKDTAVAIALALHLTFSEAEKLLKRLGYALSHSIKRDIILEYCFKAGIYEIDDVNELLSQMQEKTLGR